MIQLAISRSREYAADADGAELTGDPIALAAALEKIDRAAAALPLPADARLRPQGPHDDSPTRSTAGLSSLFCTDPPTADRIRRLRRMAGTTPGRRILTAPGWRMLTGVPRF